MSDLSDRLSRAKDELGFSTRQISSEAEKAGYKVSNATAAVYTNGKHGQPDPRTVEALSVVLRVPLTELRDLAGLPEQFGKFEPTPEADSLTRQQRDVVNEVIKMIAAGNQKVGDGNVEATSNKRAAGSAAPVPQDNDGDVAEFRPRRRPDLDRMAAYETGQTEKERLDAEAAELGEEPQ